ncbi:kynureninase-like [Paramacrobiotus metropolitanus]|uniref:kynureninase-like n=1 Tax=Paramacrobiotus metropolitanus TaxID=2943436 RepID=UPI0024463055|nr:kynureninase-like [Paramacrobiotus metropolitanus]
MEHVNKTENNKDTFIKGLSCTFELLAKSAGISSKDPQIARILDDKDPLKGFRQRFFYPKKSTLPEVDGATCNQEDDAVYLCGNSLGLMPISTPVYVQRELEKWAKTGVHGHFNGHLPWAHCDEYVVDSSARLVGALPEEVCLQSGLSVNLHLLLTAFYRPTKERHKILMEHRAFPSDHYIVASQIKLHGYDPESAIITVTPREGKECLEKDDILQTIVKRGQEIAVILFSGVQYYTAQLFDMESITTAGHDQGCIVGFDLAHTIGNTHLHLHDWNVDFAAWCSYKYLNSGAGGIGGLFLHKKWHADEMKKQGLSPLPRFEGWWSHKHETRFRMNNESDLLPGAYGFRINNPPPLLVAPLLASLEIFDEAGMDRIVEKQRLLTGYLEHLLNATVCGNRNGSPPLVTIFTPDDPKERGSQLSLTFRTPVRKINHELERRGVVCDVREPCVLRVAPAPLYNSFTDVHRFTAILQEVLTALEDSPS